MGKSDPTQMGVHTGTDARDALSVCSPPSPTAPESWEVQLFKILLCQPKVSTFWKGK